MFKITLNTLHAVFTQVFSLTVKDLRHKYPGVRIDFKMQRDPVRLRCIYARLVVAYTHVAARDSHSIYQGQIDLHAFVILSLSHAVLWL